jgi:hypothetical protein
MQFELSKILEAALEEKDELEKLKIISGVFHIINEAVPVPERFQDIAKDTFLFKNLLLCRVYQPKPVNLIIELLEGKFSMSKIFLFNYLKSLCELASLFNPEGSEKMGKGDYVWKNLILGGNNDKAKLRELTLDQFMTEVNCSVKHISESVSQNLSAIKETTLEKLEACVKLVQQGGHHQNPNFVNKFAPLLARFFKLFYDNTEEGPTIQKAFRLMTKLQFECLWFTKFVNIEEMEKLAKIGKKVSQIRKEQTSEKVKLKDRDQEQRMDSLKKQRLTQFRFDVKKYGLVEVLRQRMRHFRWLTKNNQIIRQLLENLSKPFIIQKFLLRSTRKH